ncbi:MAG: ATP/GTP-binding protein [Longispora sp.]|nr:ATP/GTP-binding protein [Longispora sp. (in: high G+C Gram-positive bacteria)]
MSPRRHRRQPDAGGKSGSESGGYVRSTQQSVETSSDGEWVVRSLSGGTDAKVYRCPGCDQEIPARVPHVVAWRADSDGEDRRHWHRACWRARGRRTPNVQRGRSAPRY